MEIENIQLTNKAIASMFDYWRIRLFNIIFNNPSNMTCFLHFFIVITIWIASTQNIEAAICIWSPFAAKTTCTHNFKCEYKFSFYLYHICSCWIYLLLLDIRKKDIKLRTKTYIKTNFIYNIMARQKYFCTRFEKIIVRHSSFFPWTM